MTRARVGPKLQVQREQQAGLGGSWLYAHAFEGIRHKLISGFT
jgi:hypothetical protein